MAAVYDDVKTLMAAVGEKIGQGAGYGWEVVVRQQFVEGIALLIGAGVCASMFAVLCWGWGKTARYDDARIPMAIGLAIAPVVFVLLLASGTMQVMNPEFYAIDFFIDVARPSATR
jgi:FtsH-binding integral membrane protein